jgi:thiamine-monophosphate kinase
MGAQPLFCLVSLALPSEVAEKFVPKFYKGLLDLAKQHEISLAGGDLASFPSVIADVMCCGTVVKNKAFLRSAARAGESIYVTGSLGSSALGFRVKRGADWDRHRRPTPRLEVAYELRQIGVRCAMDISDGLSLDLARLCTESKVSAELVSNQLPLAPHATLDDALNGGEDYELLFTASGHRKIPESIAGLPVTAIGKIRPLKSDLITLDEHPLPTNGFDHFT